MADRERNQQQQGSRTQQGSQTGRDQQQGQYRCNRCQTNFNSREELNQHEQRMHQNEMQDSRR